MRMKKTTRKQLRTIRRRRLALALVSAMAMPGAAMAQSGCFDCLPMYGEVVSGSATSNMTTGGVIRPNTDLNSNTMTITQTTKGAIIDWGSFNIGEGYGVTFDQQFGTTSVTLNRVVGFGYGGSPSFIDGTLTSNGNVFIINPAGITFGSGAQINVGGIVASTLDISNADFNTGVASGRFQFTPAPFVDTDDNGTPDAYVAGEIYNSGTITTAQGGTVAFVGSSLGNNGDITAQGGSVVFGSAQQVTLDFFGDGLTQVTINSTGVLAPPNLGCELNCTNSPSVLANYGTIAANGGQIVMRVAAPVGGGSEIINGGTLRAQGVANRAGRVELIAQGGTVSNFAIPDGFFAGSIDVSGGSFAGGSVVLQGDDVAMQSTSDQISSIDASGGTSGGSILLEASNNLTAFGVLSARGGTSGGGITTSSGGTFDIRGLEVDAGSPGSAGTWTLWAPNLTVVDGDVFGPIDGVIVPGQTVQDTDIGNALSTGTNVTLRAGTTPSDGGYIHFSDGVDIFYDDGTVPLAFRADAQGAITGDNFSITSNGASLLMAFNADANNLSYGFAGISFTGATLESNGADILFYGQSDAANGVASSYSTGIELSGTSVTTNGGNVVLRGASTGSDAGSDAAGVVVNNTSIDAGAGAVTIYGAGERETGGVFMEFVTIASGAGGVLIEGRADEGDGVRILGGDIESDGGPLSILGYGGEGGVYAYNTDLYSNGGDIAVHGEGDAADGTYFNGSITSEGGAIEIYGSSNSANGLVFHSGFSYGIDSGGGAILLTGDGVTGGTTLVGNGYGTGSIDGGGGPITIIGTASGVDATAVLLSEIDVIGASGDISVRGISQLGNGVLFEYGASISTATGAIGLYGTGADFGLDIADGAIDTDSGDITLEGTATAATAIAGVRVTGDGLTTDGGDIRVTGTSAGGVGVQLGDGSTFAIGSGGGAISIEGTGIDVGVLMQLNDVASGGGAVSVTGTGAFFGVSLEASDIDSAGGSIDIEGTASASGGSGVSLVGTQLIGGAGDVTVRGTAADGIGLLLARGTNISTTTGSIGLYGTGADFGLDITDGALDTDSGDITLEGTATAATAIAGVRVTGGGLTTDGGDIRVTGTSAGGVGVQLGDSDAFAIGSGGGAISVEGTGIDAGVLMQGNQLTSAGGAVSIIGTGATTGLSLDGSDLDSAGGSIDIEGRASGSGVGIDLANARLIAGAGDIRLFGDAALGSGVNFTGQSSVATTTGDISIAGIGASIGLDLGGGELTTDSGHIDLRGRGTSSGSIGLRIGQGVSIATDGGGIELSGQGDGGAGLVIGDGASVDAGNSLIVLRATSTAAADSIDIAGSIRSGVGVNLRPGGVDLQGQLTEAAGDSIYLGSSNGDGGFVLSNDELALIDTPELVIGSNLHAGAIQVLADINREGNLTLQNDGGSGGIDIQAGLNVGDATLALSSGGSITQTSAGAITAHSLLAQAGGDVLLAAALNDVASTTLAGSAGGDFEFQDANDLAIGSVSAIGFDTSSGQLSSFSATGIEAGGDVFVRNLQGDLTLDAGVTATNIDLVTAGRLQNVVGASLVASGNWRVWASTWDGEARGGLAGDGDLPNLYGCAYLGTCGVTVSSGDNHFIYVQQPIAVVTFDNATREYGLQNPLFTFSVTGAILGDTMANVATGSASTTATIGSDVGLYPILGSFASAAGYQIQFVPGNLAITPATLLFTADGAVRYLGFPNPDFTGTVTGFRNDDTVASVFGDTVIWSSPAGPLSPIGNYPIIGGTSARNYVFAQAPGNAAALQVILLPSVPGRPVNFIRETVNTYVYDRNFGGAPMCAVNASIDDTGLASSGDELSQEWMKVRSRPNLTNCFDSERENGCGSF